MFFGNKIMICPFLGARVIESSTSEHGSEGLRESLHEVHLPVPVRQLLRVIPGTTVVLGVMCGLNFWKQVAKILVNLFFG